MACFQERAEWPTLVLSSPKFRVPLYSYEHYIPAMDLSLYIVHCLDKNKLMYQSWAVSFRVAGRVLLDICFLHSCQCQNNQQISRGLEGISFY